MSLNRAKIIKTTNQKPILPGDTYGYKADFYLIMALGSLQKTRGKTW